MSRAERNPIRTWLRRLADIIFIFAFSGYVTRGRTAQDGDCGSWKLPGPIIKFPCARIFRQR